LAALSVIVTEALLAPVAVGSNVTLILQFEPAASVAGLCGHGLVCVKSALFAPVMAILVIASGALPVLVRVTICGELVVPTGWALKVRLVVFPKLTTGAMPVPVREITCGLPLALSVMVTFAARLPETVGLKVTLMEQFAPAFTLAPQVFV
jgi:hypothetical protein